MTNKDNNKDYFKYQISINRKKYTDICKLLDFEKKHNGIAFYIRDLINEDLKRRIKNKEIPFENFVEPEEEVPEDDVQETAETESEENEEPKGEHIFEKPPVEEIELLKQSLENYHKKKKQKGKSKKKFEISSIENEDDITNDDLSNDNIDDIPLDTNDTPDVTDIDKEPETNDTNDSEQENLKELDDLENSGGFSF